MKDWKTTLIPPETPVLEAIRVIDASALQIAVVVDENLRLLGTVTDGDIRRALLRQVPLDENVESIMYLKPTTVNSSASRDEIIAMMKRLDLRHIPVVDDDGRVRDLKVLAQMIEAQEWENLVIIMAGGLGERMQPLTEDCPKSLLKIGGKPILETILENFMEFGFRRFYISVNYKSEMIEDYFGDGDRMGAQISYLREKQRLGTAGPLSLLPETPAEPFFVMNGDLLTRVNFGQLLDFHRFHKARGTMCVRTYRYQVPYGVVQVKEQELKAIDEKPARNFFVNAGIYVLEPEVLSFVPENRYFDMPNLFERLIQENLETVAFPIHEYWLDIGQKEDLEKANGEFREVFK